MNRPVLLLLCATALAGAGPTAEIATDGIRLGWRLGALHPFITADFDVEREVSSYRLWIEDSLALSEVDDLWYYPDFAMGAGIDWTLSRTPAQAGLRLEAKYAPDVLFGDDGGFTLTARAGPLLEKRWDRFVLGASWAPTLEWRREEFGFRYRDSTGSKRRLLQTDTWRITTSTELHLRYEF